MALALAVPNSGGLITDPALYPFLTAMHIRENLGTWDDRYLQPVGTGIVYGHPRVVLTASHVLHQKDGVKNAGVVRISGATGGHYGSTGTPNLFEIEEGIPHPDAGKTGYDEMDLKIIIVRGDPVVTHVNRADFPPGKSSFRLLGYGGDGHAGPSKPPVLRIVNPCQVFPLTANDIKSPVFEATAAKHFVGRLKKHVVDTGDSGSAALPDMDGATTCYGLFSEIRGNSPSGLMFVRFTPEVHEWIKATAAVYDITI